MAQPTAHLARKPIRMIQSRKRDEPGAGILHSGSALGNSHAADAERLWVRGELIASETPHLAKWPFV